LLEFLHLCKWEISDCFYWRRFGVVAPDTCLERKQKSQEKMIGKGIISQEKLLLLHSGIGILGFPIYVHILYFGVKEVTVVNSVVTALTTLSISKSI
jgi:hypothetical protein